MGFRSAKDRIKAADEFRRKLGSPCSFGNQFLDDALDGIYPDDLVIVTAKTGGGKTELASQIAEVNALAGKSVHMFALEAYEGEIESRVKFRLLSQAFFTQKDWRSYGETPRFQKWCYNKQSDLLDKFEPEVNEQIAKSLSSLHTYYRNTTFDTTSFEANMHLIGLETDLVIIDHLHYFDLESGDETQELKKTIKSIREITQFHRKPTVVVVHIRKQDKRTSGPIPEIDDIYGSSDISKVATKIIATARAADQENARPHIFPTYFKVLKNRLDGSVSNFVGLCGFDVHQNRYADTYAIGQIKYGTSEFQLLDRPAYPSWARKKEMRLF